MSVYREISPATDTGDAELPEDAQASVLHAVEDGNLIVVPTDTVYGIAANPFSRSAIGKLLGAKGRDESMPPPVLGGIVEELLSLASFTSLRQRDDVFALAEAFWPGPLTIVVPTEKTFGWSTDDVGRTVALRMPDHDLTLSVLRTAGPLAVTSANRTGMPPATSIEEARHYFGDEVDVYIDGGPASVGQVSTIVSCATPTVHVLRQGPISASRIEELLGSY